jgi:exonuclease SbcC
MIPIRLELKNFMAYRDAAPLELGGLHMVCLTGENGAGKSTLLDAITWALWGQARAKRDDELISQTESEMRVGLVFSEGTNTYQVVRARKMGKATIRTKVPTSTGSLELLVEDKGTWRTISETKQSDTQARIIEILNLTYDTFVNSAFLKQGRADEFTLKTPAERKAVLVEILSLDKWVGYEEKVKGQQSELERAEALLQLELLQADDEIGRLPIYERDLTAAACAAAETSVALQAVESELAEIDRQRERARSLRGQRSQTEERLKTIRAEVDGLRAERARHQAVLAEYQSAIDQRAVIERGHAEYLNAVKANDAFNLKLSSLVELNARKTGAENQIADERRRLESERDAARRQLTELQRQSDASSMTEQLTILTEQKIALVEKQKARDEMAQNLVESREQLAEFKAQNDELKRQMKELKTRIDAFSSVGAICPTCGRELVEQDRERILAEWNAKGREWGNTYRLSEERSKTLSAVRTTLEAQINTADKTLIKLPALQREITAMEERITRSVEAAAKLPDAQNTLMRVDVILVADNYAQDGRVALAAVTRELTELGYDAAAHRQIRDVQLLKLQVFVDRKLRLDRAALGIESEQRALEALALRDVAVTERQVKEEGALAQLKLEFTVCEKALQRAPEVEAAVNRARNDFFTAQRKVGEANQRVQSCKALESKCDRLRSEIDSLLKRKTKLAELRTAFSKNGVPAMIIEAILPELENTAARLLDKMTNGRMTVRFETQRQTLKGDASETLELRIRDELGERPYEMFSGGEAFRINFAVRVALSKLLANRAGARLQTLFIDEGFGTQDAAGRERLVEAIRSIQDDFELIMVITHIDELKDAFPARIDVTKSIEGGSRARVM